MRGKVDQSELTTFNGPIVQRLMISIHIFVITNPDGLLDPLLDFDLLLLPHPLLHQVLTLLLLAPKVLFYNILSRFYTDHIVYL